MDLKLILGILVVTSLFCSVPGRRRGARDKPKNVAVELVNATTVIVRWDPPRLIPNCPISKYLIRLKDESVGSGTGHKVNGSIPMVIIKNLREDTDYLIRVVAITCRGKSQPTKWSSIRTLSRPMGDGKHTLSENRAPGKPSAVRTRTMTDSIIMSWQPPEGDVLVRGYMVGYGEGVPDVNWQYVSADTRNFTIRNLKPSTQYVISLRAFNNFGKGPVVYDLIYTREEDAPTVGPLTPPIGLRSRVLSPHTVWLEWIDPSLGRAQKVTDNRYYVVSYTPMPQGETRTVTVKMLNVVLYHLSPHTTYEFKVLTHKEGESTAYSISNYNSTFEAAPGSPPDGLYVSSGNESTTKIINWRPPQLANGDLTAYMLSYAPLPAQSEASWTTLRIETHRYSQELTELLPDIAYGVRMQAINSKGYGPWSETVEFFTGHRPGVEESTTTTMVRSYGTEATTPASTRPWDNLSLEMERAFKRAEQEAKERAESEPIAKVTSNDLELLPEPAKRTRPAREKTERSEPRIQLRPTESQLPEDDKPMYPSAERKVTNKDADIMFHAIVKHVVSAVVTWTEVSATCTQIDQSHYVFSYYPSISRSRIKHVNTTVPMVLLDGLMPDSKYDYEVRRIDDVTHDEWWIRSGSIDTHMRGEN